MKTIAEEARDELRKLFADPFAGMTEREIDAIARGEPLPDWPTRQRETCERYASENRGGLLLDELLNDSRVLACLARGDIDRLRIEWDRVFENAVETILAKMR